MARRYIGDAVIYIIYNDDSGDYRGIVRAGGYSWHFDDLHAPACGHGPGVGYDSSKAYDKMAESAVSFASYYTSDNRSDDTPQWAPSAAAANAISAAVCFAQDDQGNYEVRRVK